MTKGIWIYISHFQRASHSWRCRRKITPPKLSVRFSKERYLWNPHNIRTRMIYMWRSQAISKGHLPLKEDVRSKNRKILRNITFSEKILTYSHGIQEYVCGIFHQNSSYFRSYRAFSNPNSRSLIPWCVWIILINYL